MSYFLGQHLSNRPATDASPDPLRLRLWAGARYVTVFAAVLVTALLFGRSPAGAALAGLGGGVALSGILNIVLLPRHDRSPKLDATLITAGVLAVAMGAYLLASS